MGRSVKCVYAGAYLTADCTSKVFQKVVRGDEFYLKTEDRFNLPYEGLEKVNVLLPASKIYCNYCDGYGKDRDDTVFNEVVLTAIDFDFEKHKTALKQDYAEEIKLLSDLLKKPVKVAAGVVIYFDEIA